MSLGRLIEAILALGVPRVATDGNGNAIGLARPNGSHLPLAMVYAFPSTPQAYCSPIAGDPDLTKQVPLHEISAIGTGFLLPKAGIVTEIGFYTQGCTGAGASKTLRYNVCSLAQDNTAATGLKVAENLLTGTTPLADNFNGKVVVATGLNLAVPSQFMVFLKAPFQPTGTKAQAMLSAGPIPGVVGNDGAALVSTAAYTSTTLDFDAATPIVLAAGEKIAASLYKGISCYVKWKGQ
jgi:hypothetical protein